MHLPVLVVFLAAATLGLRMPSTKVALLEQPSNRFTASRVDDAGEECQRRPKRRTLYPGDAVRITTPGYGGQGYGINLDCFWKFRAPRGSGISMHCEGIQLAPNDFLVVRSGLFRHREDNKNGSTYSVVLQRSSIRVGLRSDGSGGGQGFTCLLTTRSTTKDCVCGRVSRTTRIVGGQDAEENEYPWQVALLYFYTRPFCGGFLINSFFVLTAAHCTSRKSPKYVNVLLGAHTVSSMRLNNTVAAEAFFVHPRWDARDLANDIALIKLVTALQFNEGLSVRPACLPVTPQEDHIGAVATVIGWGKLYYGGPQTDILQEVNVTVISNQDCELVYEGWVQDNMMCAMTTGKDSCQGDSGGPLSVPMVGRPLHQEVVGVVSWGHQCGLEGFPGVYSRLTENLKWIYKTSADGTFCSRPTIPGT